VEGEEGEEGEERVEKERREEEGGKEGVNRVHTSVYLPEGSLQIL
jgi:hypothetical protein